MKKFDLFGINFQGINIIEASAGTGKTWSIIHLYLKMLITHKLKVQHILVVSYTKNSTLELKIRLYKRLDELLQAIKNGFTDDLELEKLIKLCDKKDILNLELAQHNLDEASIFTIHGFCQNILNKFALESSFFEKILETDISLFVKRKIVDIFRDDMNNFSSVQIEWVVKKNLTPEEIFLNLFPLINKFDLKAHKYLLKNRTSEIEQITHSIIQMKNQFLFEYQKNNLKDFFIQNDILNKASYKTDYWISLEISLLDYLNSDSVLLNFSNSLYKLHSDALKNKIKKGYSLPDFSIFSVIDLFIEQYQKLENLLELNYENYLTDFLFRLKNDLDKDKIENDWFSFDDLLTKVFDLLNNHSSLSDLILQDFPIAFIDEFQDTDIVQYKIFFNLYKNTKGILFLVGDPKQSIYAFRGADIFTYLKALQDADNRYYLDTNYRSNNLLMDKINDLFNIPNPFLLDIQYENLKSSNNSFYVQNELPINLVTYKTDLVNLEDINIEISRNIAYKILDLFANKKLSINDTEKSIEPSDIAILVSNHSQAKIVQNQLYLLGVDSVCKTQDSIMQSEEAYVLYDILQAFLYPYNYQFTNWAKLSDFIQKEPSEILLEDNDKFIYYHNLWKKKGFLVFFYKWFLKENIALNILQSENGERKITNIFHLMDLLSIEDIKLNSMTGLVNWFSKELFNNVKNDEKLLRLESDKKRINILTIHAAKGLEYPIVFCPFLWSYKEFQNSLNTVNIEGEIHLVGLLNNKEFDAFVFKEQLAERIRLLYVSITRAKASLYIYIPFGNLKINEKVKKSSLGYLLFSNHYSNLQDYIFNFQIKEHHFLSNFLNVYPLENLSFIKYQKEEVEFDLVEPDFFGNVQTEFEIVSFSSLSYGALENLPDYDEKICNFFLYDKPSESLLKEEDFYDFPKGAKAGLCVHKLMELWATEQGNIYENTLFCLKMYGINEKWQNILINKFNDIIHADLGGFALKDVELQHRKTEIEFTFPCQLDKIKITSILKKYNFDPNIIHAFNLLSFSNIKGFLKGFIDLIFFFNGKYYIVDYKTNYLGNNPQDYSNQYTYQSIINEHYYLQYIIYSIALRRFLKSKLKDFSDELLGGVYYLFIRAIPHEGIYFTKLREDFLEELDAIF